MHYFGLIKLRISSRFAVLASTSLSQHNRFYNINQNNFVLKK
jgi:hypothetical protein